MGKRVIASLIPAVIGLLLVACEDTAGQAPAPTVGPPAEATASPTPLASPSPKPSPLPSPTARADDLAGAPLLSLRLADPIELPDGLALIVETGCWGCDGPAAGFVRVYRDPSGALRTDILFDPSKAGLGSRATGDAHSPLGEPYITGFAFAPDASDMVVAVCTHLFCGGLGYPDPHSETTLLRSRDGGVTWSRMRVLAGGHYPIGLAGGKAFLVESRDPATSSGPIVRVLPDERIIEPPPSPGNLWPALVINGEVLWANEEGHFFDTAGNRFMTLVDDYWTLRPGYDTTPVSDDTFAVAIYAQRPDENKSHGFLGVFTNEGDLQRAFQIDGISSPIGGGAFLDSTTLFTSIDASSFLPQDGSGFYYGLVPVIVDLEELTVRPVPHPFTDETFVWPNPRNRVQALLQGKLARVVDTGSCLRIREQPSLEAKVLDCAADGVLLVEQGEPIVAAGVEWVPVALPSGTKGWASASFLER